MRRFHTACGSTKLERSVIARKKRLIPVMICLHCARMIESYEITEPHPLVVSKVSDARLNSPADFDMFKDMVIAQRSWPTRTPRR